LEKDDYDIIGEGQVVGRIYRAAAAPPDRPWMWSITAVRQTAHGFEASLRDAKAVFAARWRAPRNPIASRKEQLSRRCHGGPCLAPPPIRFLEHML
jgi:hypothetical protein